MDVDVQKDSFDSERIEEWKKIVEENNLDGQKFLIEDKKSPIPFLFMNNTIQKACELLCRKKVEISQFKESPIPLEALKAYGLAVHEKYFTKIEIWSNDSEDDPFMVGIIDNEHQYIMARWGEESLSWDQIIEKAKSQFKTRRLKSLQAAIGSLEDDVEKYFNERWFTCRVYSG